jgi:hypothetical protein
LLARCRVVSLSIVRSGVRSDLMKLLSCLSSIRDAGLTAQADTVIGPPEGVETGALAAAANRFPLNLPGPRPAAAIDEGYGTTMTGKRSTRSRFMETEPKKR